MTDELRDNVPQPDPTRLTTEATDRLEATLRREIEHVRECIEDKIEANALLRDEKTQAITDRLKREENHRLENKTDAERGVERALAAAKEAGEKAEKAVEKQLTEIKETFASENKATRRDIDDLKNRASEVAAAGVERRQATTDTRADRQLSIGVVGAMVGGSAVILALIVALANALSGG